MHLNKTHKSRVKYDIKYDLYKSSKNNFKIFFKVKKLNFGLLIDDF